jgi:hypothetical protein
MEISGKCSFGQSLDFSRRTIVAATNPTFQEINSKLHPRLSIYEKLNVQWHERALQLFMIVVLAHWAEHLAQAVQIWVLHWPRPKAGGALIMLVGIWVLRKGFVGTSRKWWTVALIIQFWHHIEHLLLIGQATFHHNLFGSPVPASILQLFAPRVELHLFYNTIVFIPMIIGMYYHLFLAKQDAERALCSCAWQSRPAYTS